MIHEVSRDSITVVQGDAFGRRNTDLPDLAIPIPEDIKTSQASSRVSIDFSRTIDSIMVGLLMHRIRKMASVRNGVTD